MLAFHSLIVLKYFFQSFICNLVLLCRGKPFSILSLTILFFPKSQKRVLKRAPFLYQRMRAGARSIFLDVNASGSAFFFWANERERERVRHFEERANALDFGHRVVKWNKNTGFWTKCVVLKPSFNLHIRQSDFLIRFYDIWMSPFSTHPVGTKFLLMHFSLLIR